MVDAAGTTAYAYLAPGYVFTEDSDWSTDTVTAFHFDRMAVNAGGQRPKGAWAGGLSSDRISELTRADSS